MPRSTDRRLWRPLCSWPALSEQQRRWVERVGRDHARVAMSLEQLGGLPDAHRPPAERCGAQRVIGIDPAAVALAREREHDPASWAEGSPDSLQSGIELVT